MYYDEPEAEESYTYQASQYMFGDDILVAPITEASALPCEPVSQTYPLPS